MYSKDFDQVIEAENIEKNYWIDLWKFRELLLLLAWKEILVRYKQTILGVSWSVLRPFLTMLIFVFVFNKLIKINDSNTPYPILVFVALLPWQLFSNSMSETSGSLVANSNLISKIYFPRLIIPISTIAVCLIDFLISSVILALLMIYYSFVPDINIIFLPFFLLLVLFFAIGVGVWLAALNVKYRDFRFVVPFVIQFGLYISPVGFNSDIVPPQWKFLYSLNPMVGIIDGFRWCFLGDKYQLYLPGFLLSLLIVGVIILIGLRYFRQTEKSFADKI